MENFDEYLRQGEPNKAEKAKAWKTAIGLQQVDGLQPSDYLIATARQNIDGDISIAEGNTRTTAIFLIKYLRTFGFEVNNKLFEQYSWYFRNALVIPRANYKNHTKNIHATNTFLLH
jgi:hypothetical protein